MNSGELLVLTSGQSLFVTGSGVYGANIPITIHYALSTPSSFTEYSTSIFLSGLSIVALSGPSVGSYLIREISIYNKDTINQDITLGISDSTYSCTIRKYSLIPGAVGTIGGMYHNGSLDTNLDLTSTLDLHSITEAHEGSDQIISFTGAGQVVDGELTARIAMAGPARDGALRKEDFQIFGDHAQINHLSYATSGHTGFEPTVTKGNLTVSSVTGQSSVLSVTGGTNAVIGSGSLVKINKSDSTHDGYLSSTDWGTFNGKEPAVTKGNLTTSSVTSQATVLSVVGGTSAVIGSGTLVKINKADTTHDGYISSTDWNTFNGKEPAVSKGNLTESTSSVLTISNGTGSVIGSGTTIQVKVAGTSQSGYLSSTDWNTFNGKASSGSNSDITSISGLTTPLSIAQGGTGNTSASTAINALVPLQSGNTGKFLSTNGSAVLWADAGGAGGVDHSILTNLSYATAGHTGFEPTVTKGNLTVSSVAGQASVLSVVGGTGSVIGSGSLVKINKADTTHDGYISSTDWNTFNGKEPAVSKGNLTESTSSVLTISNGTGSVIGSGTTIQVKVAGTSQSGYLSSTDWNTFNGKQAALGYTAESTSNKSTTTTLGTSDTLYPTQNAVKTYADSKVTDTIADGVTTIAPSQNAVYDALAGKQASLGYTAENTANKSNDTALGSSTSYYPTQNAVKSYVDTAVSTKITASSTDTLTNKTLSSTTNTIIITTRTINTQTGTTYTLVASDAGKIITLNNGSAIAVTIPQNSSVAFPTNTQIDCIQLGAGKVTFSGSGVTINSKSSNKSIGAQYVGCTLLKTDTDTWVLLGDLIA